MNTLGTLHTETERKFLVRSDAFIKEATEHHDIIQAYICRKERTVRVRLCDNEAFLTIKGKSPDKVSRLEWEIKIDPAAAKDLLKLCTGSIIIKTRYIVPETTGHNFEVDVYSGDNAGLVVAEIELEDKDEPFDKPSWLAEEVTQDTRYRNAALSITPFTSWE